MKIEMALPTLEIGGMEQMVVSLSMALAERGHDVGITCVNQKGILAEVARRANLRVSLVPAPGIKSQVFAPALKAHFERLAPDVVHTHNGVWGRAGGAARRAKVARVIHTIHGRQDCDPWYDVVLTRFESRTSDVVVAVSDSLANYLVNRIGLSESRLVRLINGVDAKRFAPDLEDRNRLRGELNLEGRFVIGIVARLAYIKNHTALIAAVGHLREYHPNILLLIVGDGPMESELRAQVFSHSLDSHVRFLGVRTDTPSLHRAFDLFTLSSHAEGTSISLLEAMASGTPVIATAVGGNVHLLDNGRCGALVATTDSFAIATTIQDALRDGSALRSRALFARERVLEHFSQNAMVTKYEQIYTGSSHSGLSAFDSKY